MRAPLPGKPRGHGCAEPSVSEAPLSFLPFLQGPHPLPIVSRQNPACSTGPWGWALPRPVGTLGHPWHRGQPVSKPFSPFTSLSGHTNRTLCPCVHRTPPPRPLSPLPPPRLLPWPPDARLPGRSHSAAHSLTDSVSPEPIAPPAAVLTQPHPQASTSLSPQPLALPSGESRPGPRLRGLSKSRRPSNLHPQGPPSFPRELAAVSCLLPKRGSAWSQHPRLTEQKVCVPRRGVGRELSEREKSYALLLFLPRLPMSMDPHVLQAMGDPLAEGWIQALGVFPGHPLIHQLVTGQHYVLGSPRPDRRGRRPHTSSLTHRRSPLT